MSIQRFRLFSVIALASVAVASFGASGCSSTTTDCATTRSCAPAANGGEPDQPETTDEAGAGGGSPVAGGAGASAHAGAAGEAALPDESGNCSAGRTACAARCVDISADANHCGRCGNACAVGSICSDGECEPCAKGQVACDGRCIDPKRDARFCGASNDCAAERSGAACGAFEACADGQCVSDDASLRELSIDPARLTPSFSSEELAYTAGISYFESRLELRATPSSPDASMSYADTELTPDESLSVVTTPEAELAAVKVDVTAASGKLQSYEVKLERSPLVTTRAKAFNSHAGLHFGYSVALSGDTAVFGAPDEDGAATGVDGDENASGPAGAGAVYVAVRDADGHWSRQAYLKPDVVEEGAQFGAAVAIDGDTIAVGAPGAAGTAGRVYVFARQGTKWYQQFSSLGFASQSGNSFGSAVVVQGDRMAVAAPGSSRYIGRGGLVLTYARAGATWKMDFPPRTPEVLFEAGYGYGLAMSGDRMAASQKLGDFSVATLKLNKDSNKWEPDGVISLPLGATNVKVAIDGDTVATSSQGNVTLFTYADGVWLEQASVKPFTGAAVEGFGASLAMKDGLLVVGSACDDCMGGFSTFVRRGDTWIDGSYVTANDLNDGDVLGYSVAVDGNRVLAGAPGEDSSVQAFEQTGVDNESEQSGAAFIFE